MSGRWQDLASRTLPVPEEPGAELQNGIYANVNELVVTTLSGEIYR